MSVSATQGGHNQLGPRTQLALMTFLWLSVKDFSQICLQFLDFSTFSRCSRLVFMLFLKPLWHLPCMLTPWRDLRPFTHGARSMSAERRRATDRCECRCAAAGPCRESVGTWVRRRRRGDVAPSGRSRWRVRCSGLAVRRRPCTGRWLSPPALQSLTASSTPTTRRMSLQYNATTKYNRAIWYRLVAWFSGRA